jgi:ArsR family transcriptional regulator, arsenate/arsenite/antimonite-responsive transcriptional repressor
VTALAALAQHARLQVFRELVVAGSRGMTPGQLSERLDIVPNTLSFHLKSLNAAGLVEPERDGRHLIYRARFERMNVLLAYLTAHCCGGSPCAVDETLACRDGQEPATGATLNRLESR